VCFVSNKPINYTLHNMGSEGGEKEKNENSKNLDFWMIRPCEMYKNEYDDCTSIKSRLHQIFVHGNTVDCNHWHEDYSNCLKWKKSNDINAAETLVLSEKIKIRNRLKSFYANDVWETRRNPPENWNDPLPEYIAKRRAYSTLNDTLDDQSKEKNNSLCSIM